MAVHPDERHRQQMIIVEVRTPAAMQPRKANDIYAENYVNNYVK